jgi:hypothetical protein
MPRPLPIDTPHPVYSQLSFVVPVVSSWLRPSSSTTILGRVVTTNKIASGQKYLWNRAPAFATLAHEITVRALFAKSAKPLPTHQSHPLALKLAPQFWELSPSAIV